MRKFWRSLWNRKKCFLGIDVGATKIKFLCLKGTEIHRPEIVFRINTPKNPEEALIAICQALPLFCSRINIVLGDVAGIGICLPMAVDLAGVPAAPPNLSSTWSGFPLRERMEQASSIPTRVLNDGNAVALGELIRLCPDPRERKGKSLLVMSGGTGLAGGWVFNGEAFLGADGFAGEVGHMMCDLSLAGIAQLLQCGCGKPSCIEPYVSLSGLEATADRWQRESFLPEDHPLRQLPKEEWAFNMLRLANDGDERCMGVFELQARCLGIGFGSIINLLNPDFLVLGGGIAETGEDFKRAYLEKFFEGMRLKGMSFIAERYDENNVIFSDGDYAAFGAAHYVRQALAG